MSGNFYSQAREGAKGLLKHTPLYEFARRFEEHAKGMFVPGTMFEEFGFNYVGPIDGHDLDSLIPTLAEPARARSGPQFLHIVTQQGAGLQAGRGRPGPVPRAQALRPGPVGIVASGKRRAKKTYTQVFSDWLCDHGRGSTRTAGRHHARRCAKAPAWSSSRSAFRKRYFDVGIAEQHSGHLRRRHGLRGPQAGGRHLLHVPAARLRPADPRRGAAEPAIVTFALDRAGLVGADGATHAGNYDIAFTRCIPNMAVLTPADERECRQLLSTAYAHRGPATVRYPRGAGTGVDTGKDLSTLPWGRGELRREGQGVAILAFGSLLQPALQAAERLGATVANMRFVKPLDTELLERLARSHTLLVTVEDGCVMGGAGSAVAEHLHAAGLTLPVLQLGLPDRFIQHGDPVKLMAEIGLDAEGIERSIRQRLGAPATLLRAVVND
jgi:1-deoxy-D-xylulose-5-phosphate synthase